MLFYKFGVDSNLLDHRDEYKCEEFDLFVWINNFKSMNYKMKRNFILKYFPGIMTD